MLRFCGLYMFTVCLLTVSFPFAPVIMISPSLSPSLELDDLSDMHMYHHRPEHIVTPSRSLLPSIYSRSQYGRPRLPRARPVVVPPPLHSLQTPKSIPARCPESHASFVFSPAVC
ncbi:hypothetical protein LXA43DRAFT_645754 [Ganoderma leucocontextum]|nr:hypothetical protein LXA43DRAFT_645754 [Ganoderma leucocontextum]